MNVKTNKKALVHAYIDAHPGASLTEVAREVGVSRALVSIVRAEDRAASGDFLPARSPGGALDSDIPSAQTFAEVIQQVLLGNGLKLSPLQQAQVYSGLATHPKAHPGTVISALNGLRALEASAAQTNDIGPGIPLTPEQRIHRLSLLLEACGPTTAKAAWSRAFPSSKYNPTSRVALTPTPPSETDVGASLLVLDPIPEGTHDETPVATQREALPAERSIDPFPDPMEEPGVS